MKRTAKRRVPKKKVKKAKKVKASKPKKMKASKSKMTKKAPAPKPIAKVIHYYDRIGVAIVAVNTALNVGEKVKFQRGPEEFTQCICSMQMEHENIAKAKKGAEVGVKVEKPVKEGALVLPAA